MDKNSEIIKTEIIRILNENGKTRGSELVKRVIEKMGNEKTVYREISLLVETGEIEKKVYSRSHIEYQLINLHESVNKQLRALHKEINIIFDEITNWDDTVKEEEFSFYERLRSVIHVIHVVQAIDGIMKLLSFYPTFKKDQMFSQVNRKINDCWQSILNIVMHQPEEDFLNYILTNLRASQFDSKMVN